MELPPGWQTDGSMYHGLSLSLVTARGRSTAEVVAWLPAAKSDRTDFFGEPVPLFRVRYVDGATPGFEVDLEDSEVRDSLTEASRAKLGMPALAPVPAAPPISPCPRRRPAVAPGRVASRPSRRRRRRRHHRPQQMTAARAAAPTRSTRAARPAGRQAVRDRRHHQTPSRR